MESTVEKNEDQLFNGKTFEEKMKSLSPLYAVLYVSFLSVMLHLK